MAKVQVVFHDGTASETEVTNYSAAAISEQLNSDALTVAIGDVIAHRGTIARVTPVVTATTTTPSK